MRAASPRSDRLTAAFADHSNTLLRSSKAGKKLSRTAQSIAWGTFTTRRERQRAELRARALPAVVTNAAPLASVLASTLTLPNDVVGIIATDAAHANAVAAQEQTDAHLDRAIGLRAAALRTEVDDYPPDKLVLLNVAPTDATYGMINTCVFDKEVRCLRALGAPAAAAQTWLRARADEMRR